jgi:hypothetical protein
VRQLDMGSHGIRVSEPVFQRSGVLSGMPRVTVE